MIQTNSNYSPHSTTLYSNLGSLRWNTERCPVDQQLAQPPRHPGTPAQPPRLPGTLALQPCGSAALPRQICQISWNGGGCAVGELSTRHSRRQPFAGLASHLAIQACAFAKLHSCLNGRRLTFFQKCPPLARLYSAYLMCLSPVDSDLGPRALS
jgi:hypothetical protein